MLSGRDKTRFRLYMMLLAIGTVALAGLGHGHDMGGWAILGVAAVALGTVAAFSPEIASRCPPGAFRTWLEYTVSTSALLAVALLARRLSPLEVLAFAVVFAPVGGFVGLLWTRRDSGVSSPPDEAKADR